jgi:desulfoferrodoxin (superoxide reductase-like protein)
MRPKKNGGWDKPFDPREINNNFTEGNSWQYSFFVPQDIQGMVEAYGGPEKFETKLDEMFNSESKTTGREQVDVTGLIGQYAHGNEPSHHMAYLYNYIGKPEKTKAKVHYILNEFYKNTPDGLIGNEDCGQMSAWYVLSSMGIYAVTPGKTGWSTTEPYFESIKVHLNDNKTDYISKDREGDYLQYFGLEEFQKTPHQEAWQPILPVPVIEAKGKAFKDQMEVSIGFNKLDFAASQTNLKAYYRINNAGAFQLYDKPFTISETAKIEAYLAPDFMVGSDTISATYYKKPNNYTIAIKSTYNPQYHAGGPEGLLDGINGTTNWRKGDWQGYQTQDFEAVIDLQKEQKVSDFHSTFLQDQRSWILMPTKVEYYVSSDNINFTLVATVDNDIDPKTDDNQIKDFGITLPKTLNARYVKVKAYNFGKLPEWHLGYPYNGDAFIFIDEITIK